MKTKNLFELDPERLATTDEHGNRIYLYPEDVKGVWKTRRKRFYWFLIGLYLILPWIYIKNRPALMVNISEREFTFMGFTLHGVEPILFFTLLASGLFMMAFLTSLLGRVWCGWACPQTVFIQSIFLKIESLIEGKARFRRELDLAPWTTKKMLKRFLKWSLYFIVSLHIAHTFVGYFVGPRELLFITTHTPSENWGLFLTTMIFTGIILVDFGWFREQFCLVACPYGRIQSVMMDENSLVVSYDVKRGEPRKGTEGVLKDQEGDCINCYNCVKVCPTGIDIRRGNQLECIACTQCIDACDDIMTKLHKPKGLIRYSSEVEIQGKKRSTFTKRSLLYIFFATLFFTLFLIFMNQSTQLDLVFLRDKNPFQILEKGRLIMNHFTLKITHQGDEQFKIDFRMKDPDLRSKIQILTPVHPVFINRPEKKIIIFFKFHPEILLSGTRKDFIEVIDATTQEVLTTKEVVLVGPVE